MKPMILLNLGVLALTVINAVDTKHIEENLDKLKNECRENDYVIRRHFDTNDEDLNKLREDINNLRTDLDGSHFKR